MDIYFADPPALCGEIKAWLEGTTWPLGNDRFGIKLPSGNFLSVQPDATYQERPAVGGSYEIFTLDPAINVLIVQPRTALYKIAYRER